MFNAMFKTGYFPDVLTNALIVHDHKKGSNSDPNNFRGISLLSSLAKLFTSVLNQRLYVWSQSNDKLYLIANLVLDPVWVLLMPFLHCSQLLTKFWPVVIVYIVVLLTTPKILILLQERICGINLLSSVYVAKF